MPRASRSAVASAPRRGLRNKTLGCFPQLFRVIVMTFSEAVDYQRQTLDHSILQTHCHTKHQISNSMTTNEQTTPATVSERIAARIDPARTDLIGFDRTGSLAFQSASDMMEFAKMMAISGQAIPKHLRDNPGGCLAITIQAREWAMSPFAVANKSYCVNDRISYEAQLVSAVILRRAPIQGRFTIEYTGEGDKRVCKVSVKTIEGETVEYQTPEIGKITTKNSPLWKSDPDQQLAYFAQRSLCRRHFPDVLLGVYTQDEIDAAPMRDVTPKAPSFILPETPAETEVAE